MEATLERSCLIRLARPSFVDALLRRLTEGRSKPYLFENEAEFLFLLILIEEKLLEAEKEKIIEALMDHSALGRLRKIEARLSANRKESAKVLRHSVGIS